MIDDFEGYNHYSVVLSWNLPRGTDGNHENPVRIAIVMANVKKLNTSGIQVRALQLCQPV